MNSCKHDDRSCKNNPVRTPFRSLTELYARAATRPVAIAHRGACGLYPENTALAMRKAIALGADMIEFDLRLSKDGIPVLLHDSSIDRTSDGKGTPGEYSLAELKRFNFSYFRSIWGERLAHPSYAQLEIPTFEEILREFHGKCAMNIQVYDSSDAALKIICALFREYKMFDIGFLAMSSFEAAEKVKALDPEIEVAVLGAWDKRATPEEIKRCKDFGCRFIQPPIEQLTKATFDACKEYGIHPNIFFSDTDLENRQLIAMGASGILSNRCDLLIETLDALDAERNVR